MADLIFPGHAREGMQADSVTEEDVYHVVGDFDDVLHYDDGRTRYTRSLEDGRVIVVILEDDGRTVVTAWEDKRQRRRLRR